MIIALMGWIFDDFIGFFLDSLFFFGDRFFKGRQSLEAKSNFMLILRIGSIGWISQQNN